MEVGQSEQDEVEPEGDEPSEEGPHQLGGRSGGELRTLLGLLRQARHPGLCAGVLAELRAAAQAHSTGHSAGAHFDGS
ncbi:MAG: hypothetical protein WC822_01325 [Candidatus Paceibacterota bacterium]